MEPLDEIAIRARVESGVFARGKNYWKQGAVLSLAKRGDSLRAKVEGSDYEPYRITIRWQDDGEIEATCTCPYAEEEGDWCKHIVAVLLQYSNGIVKDQTPLSELLSELSQRDLLDLIVEVSEREPKFYEAIVAAFNGEDPEEKDDESEYDY